MWKLWLKRQKEFNQSFCTAALGAPKLLTCSAPLSFPSLSKAKVQWLVWAKPCQPSISHWNTGALCEEQFMELSKHADTWSERAYSSRVGSGSSWCFKAWWSEVKMPVQPTDDKRTVQWCQNWGFWAKSPWMSGDIKVIRLCPGKASQASLSKTNSKTSALVLATLLKSEEVNNYLL